MSGLLTKNIHEGTGLPENQEKIYLVSGNYEYYHYLCDGFDDRGWGCGYRTLQTLCSWMTFNCESNSKVPSINEIQQILVQLEDKPESFIGSTQWIGSFESIVTNHNWTAGLPTGRGSVALVSIDQGHYEVHRNFVDGDGSRPFVVEFYGGGLCPMILEEIENNERNVCLAIDKLYDIPCKILHVNNGDELSTIVGTLVTHFVEFGSPVMMGGDVDCSSKGIMGIDVGGSEPSLLVVDPHYVGKEQSKEILQNKGWVKWQPLRDFLNSSFYNLCLPQVKSNCKVT